MGSFRRSFISFVVLFDILGFAFIFIIMSNSVRSDQDNVIYMAESDGTFASAIAIAGIVVNIGLAYVLLRGRIAAGRQGARDRDERGSRITGE